MFFLWAFLFSLLLTGCPKNIPDTRIDFPDMHIEVDPEGKLPAKFWDVYSLFSEANKNFDDGNFEKALVLYQKVVATYPENEMAGLSVFNAGLCLEELKRYDEALQIYGQLQRAYPKAVDPIRLQFRYAYCYESSQRWAQALPHLSAILALPKVTPGQKIQAEARIAIATFNSGQKEKAKKLLRAAMETYEDLRTRRITDDSHYYGKTCFTLGEYYLEQAMAVNLEGDQTQLEVNLETKAQIFILARAQYLKAIRTYDQTWLFASLFRIGQGYESFYFAMLNAPVPADVEGAEKERYIGLLKEKIQPVIDKALEAYRQNLKIGARLKVDNQWLQMTKEHYDKLNAWKQEHSQ